MSELIQRLNRRYLGKKYQLSPFPITVEKVREYALATNEKNPRYLNTSDLGELYVPPLLPIMLVMDVMEKTKRDCPSIGINPLRMVMGEFEMYWIRDIHPGDTIQSNAEIVKMREVSGLDIIDVLVRCNRFDETLIEMIYRFIHFVKPKRKKDKPPTSQQQLKPKEQSKLGKKIAEKKMYVTEDQAIRYGEISGDTLPIHSDEKFAQLLGFPEPILHGPCIIAFALQAVVDELLGGDPTKLKTFRVRVKDPVFMGQTLTTEIYETLVRKEGYKVVHFITINPEGVKVLSNGVVEYKK